VAEIEGQLTDAKQALTAAKRAANAAEKGGDAREIAAAKKAKGAAQAKVDKLEDSITAQRQTLREATRAASKAETGLRNANKELESRREYLNEPDENVAVQDLVRGKTLGELETDFQRA
jgi:hypothetical protein